MKLLSENDVNEKCENETSQKDCEKEIKQTKSKKEESKGKRKNESKTKELQKPASIRKLVLEKYESLSEYFEF